LSSVNSERSEITASDANSVEVRVLPNYSLAIIPPQKLWGYALSPTHKRGKHKARVFQSVLGLEQQDWPYLRDQIIEGLPESEAVLRYDTVKYQKWEVPILVAGRSSHQGYVTTGWIVRAEDERPQLTSAYVEKSARNRRLLAEDEPFRAHRTVTGEHSTSDEMFLLSAQPRPAATGVQ
jgi:Domain of unknown function (DUF6883)